MIESRMEIHEVKTNGDLLAAFPVLNVLRPALTPEALALAFPLQSQEGYRLFALTVEGRVAACIGWRLVHKLSSGRTMYVDDLVTAPHQRGKGYAQALLEHAEAEARATGCASFTLDSGHQRHDAHRLYLNFKMRIAAHHFHKDL